MTSFAPTATRLPQLPPPESLPAWTAPVPLAARTELATKDYGRGDTAVRALDAVTVGLPAERFTAVMGPSGSGKSTLMHCLAGLDTLTSGRAYIGDVDLGTLSDRELTRLRRERVGFVFQAYNLLPTLDAKENITLPLALAGRRPDRAWLRTIVETVGLGDRLSHRPSELSGGQQQRVAVARALASRPDLVFADEPTGNLDTRAGGEILAFLRTAVDEFGQTIVMVTHDAVAASHADTVLFLEDGRLVDTMAAPTPDRILDAMMRPAKALDAMLTVTLAGIWARKRRLLGTCTAVVLGVAFLAATLVLADSMRAGFNRAFTEANAGTDVVVRSSTVIGSDETKVRDTIPSGVLDTVAAVDGVAVAVPSIEGTATIIGADGDRIGGDGPPTTGANWIDDPDLNPYRLAEGRAPAADDEVVIDRGSAERGDLAVGDRTTVLTPDPVEVTIAGIATFGDVDSLGPTTYTAFTLDAARDLLLDRPGALSSVLVAAEDGVNPTTLRDEIAQLVPARIEALTQQELTAEQEADIESDFLGMFEVILLAFAGIALVVAAFSIHNTFSILVAQRTRESALLRAMGASRRQVLLAVAMEAVVVAVVASAIGLGVGLGLATGLDAILSGSGLDLPGGLVVSADALVVAAAVGVVTTLLASLAPAVSASKVAPLAALRDVAVDRSAASRVRAVAGVVITVAGVLAVATATIIDSDGAVSRAALGALAVVVGAVVLGPVVARPAAGLLGGVAPTFSGRLARRNAMRNPRRIAGSASALMVGTAVVALFTTFGSSIKASFDEIVDDQFAGDLIVQQEGFSGAGLPPELATAIETRPEIASATGLSLVTASVDGSTADATAADPAALTEMLDVGVTAGSVRNMSAGQVAISEQYAEAHDLAIGDSIPMTFVDGATVDLSVAAVYAERTTVEDLLITSEDWAPHAPGRGDVVVFIDLAPGVDEATGAAAVDAVTAQLSAPESMTRDEYLDFVGNEVDQMLTFVYGMLGIAVLIALLGIGNTLSLSIHERRRELGLLRAVGQSRTQLRATVRWESVIVAVFGTLGGLAVGTFLGWGLVRAVNAQEGFGVFDAPVGALGVVLVLAAAAGVLAALRPARRAARLEVMQAIAAE